MAYIILGLATLGIVFGPSLWARGVLRWFGEDRPYIPGTGGELARHLLDERGLNGVLVEGTDQGDHYDPSDKAVRLSRQNLNGRSLTAVATAAHEVGHALQDRDDYAPLKRRTWLVKSTFVFQRIGSVIILGAPIVGAIVHSPSLFLVQIAAGILTMGVSVIVHLATLPVEFDASFERALPILDRGGYLPPEDLPAARRILRACALTYVAASLVSLLNLWHWIRVLR
jgi:Zn-dependent membrane protease YugP